MKTPWSHQDAANKALFKFIFDEKNRSKNPLIVAPVAAGKSLMIAEFIKDVHKMYPRTRVVVLTHVKELLTQNAKELMGQYPDCDFGFYCASLGQKKLYNDVTFASIQSIHNKVLDFNRVPEIIIIDECFTGETLIETSNGEKRIDQVSLGDIVYNATGKGKVKAISKKSSETIYKVRLSNGKNIRCTGNHPFLSEQGWVAAKELDKGSRLFSVQDMPELWRKFPSVGIQSDEKKKDVGYNTTRDFLRKNSILLNILLKEDGKCNVGKGGKRKDGSNFKKDRSQAICSWWERQGLNRTTKENTRDSRRGMDCGVGYPDKDTQENETIPNMLQGRFRTQDEKTDNRIGRENTLWEKKNSRQEEGRFSSIVRVENIEIEERGCSEIVYNLQVEGHPSYFANGILVHNCHLISHNGSTQYRRFIDSVMEINPNCKIVGYTGTPFRSDTGRLDEGDNRLFDSIAYEIGMDYMIEEGYWAKPVCPNIATKMDVSGVAIRDGDYVSGQLEEAINTEEINDACVKETLEKGKDRKKWLVFTAGVQHAEDVCKEFVKAGINTEFITSATPKTQRDEIIKRFKRGDIRCLVNVAVLTTGFDVPDIDLIVFMRPTRSVVLYIQTVGRGVRVVYADGYDLQTKEGRLASIAASIKPDCMVLDFGGVVKELGPIDKITIKKSHKEKDEDGGIKGDPITKICPSCGIECFAGQRYCYECSYCFIVLDEKASNGAVVSMDEEPEWLDVIGVFTGFHQNADSSYPSMKVSYATMKTTINEWICFEHHKFEAGNKKRYAWDMACKWHKYRRYDIPPPKSVMEGLDIEYPEPSRILVKKKGKFWKVLKYDFKQVEKKAELEDDFEIPF